MTLCYGWVITCYPLMKMWLLVYALISMMIWLISVDKRDLMFSNITRHPEITQFLLCGQDWQNTIISTLQWRHNEHDGVSNHQPHDCLLNRLFRRRSNKTSKLCVTGLCGGMPVNSPHKGPVTREMFPFVDVIMRVFTRNCCKSTNNRHNAQFSHVN